MSKTFFLTRQTKNLMEGFARGLKSQAGLCLLYGGQGTGKTRLLEELAQTHLKDSRVRWMDLKAGSSGDGARIDSSVMIEKTFAMAKPGDIIVADHFEMALKKTRHQLFLSWSTDGIDKQLSMIIAANTDYFNELKKLSQQYQIRVQSFQQLPFSDDEAAAFLGFYLFPDRPISQLSIPSLLRNQLSMAQGRVGKIVAIAERAGDQITSLPMNDNESIKQGGRVIVKGQLPIPPLLRNQLSQVQGRAGKIVEIAERAGDQIISLPVNDNGSIKQGSRVIVGVLMAAAVVVVTGWYFINSKAQIDEMTIAEPGSPLVGQLQQMQLPVGSTVEADQAADQGEVVEVATEELTDEVNDSATTQSIDAPGGVAEYVSSEEPASDLPEVSASDSTLSMGDTDSSDSETPLPVPVTELTAAEELQPLASSMTDESATDAVLSDQNQTQQRQEGNAVEDGKVTNAEEASVDTVAASEVTPSGSSSGSVALSLFDRLQRDLQTSLEWINGRDIRVGTLQIMLLNQMGFKQRVYYEYLDRLADEGVDLAELKIFETYTRGQRAFSVVFGEYQNRRSAADAKAGLPKILRDASPIPRSVGGLMEEMRRLEGKN